MKLMSTTLLVATVLIAILAQSSAAQVLPPDRSSILKQHDGALKASLLEPIMRATGPAHLASTLSMPAPLDSFFVKYMATYHIPGMAACIIKKNRVAWQGYYGFANLARNIPVSDSTIFFLASISKTVVATALMQLYEAGRFQLSDDVNKYLPFAVTNPSYPNVPITFKMLLTHTTSIQDDWNVIPTLPGDPTVPIGTFLREYLTPGGQYYNASLNFYPIAPGTAWNYSNIGATLCAYLVEIFTGMPFERYCKDSIFVPLRMTRTGWFLRELDTTLIARPYTYSSGSYVDNGLYGLRGYPAADLRTTVPSLARFLMANMNGGELEGSRVLDSATVRLMHTRWFTGDPWDLYTGQGLLWMNGFLSGNECWYHNGGFTGAMTAMWMSKENGTGIIYLCNFSPDEYPGTIVEEHLMAAADTLGGATGNPKFDKGILLVNGVDFSTYGTEIRSAYLDKSYSGRYPISFWDCFPSAPSGGYPSNLPTPIGRGPIPLEVLSNYSTVIWVGNAYNGDWEVWNATPLLTYLQLGGNVILLTKNGSGFVNSVLNDYLGLTWVEMGQTLSNSIATYPGLTTLRPLGSQTLNDVFSTTLMNSESKILFTATGPFSGERGIGVWRKPAAGGAFKKSGGNLVFVSGRNYRWNHSDLQANMEFFLNKFMGEQVATGVDVVSGIPLTYDLSQNYPNPFNPSTNIEFWIANLGFVSLKIFDVLGREISTLVNEMRAPGAYTVRWDASSVSSGVYLYQLRAGGFVETKKMVLTK
jgi:CubicO group peptidase (beta-lactamase class C family)